MDWNKVKELRKKVLAEEERAVKEAIRGDERRKRMWSGPPKTSRRRSGVQNMDEAQERKVREAFGWDPNKKRKR